MSTADKDGRMARLLHERLTILSMEIHNDIAEAMVEFDAAMECAFPENAEDDQPKDDE